MKKMIMLIALVLVSASIVFSASNITMFKLENINEALVENILVITNDYIVITKNYLDNNGVTIQKETKNMPFPGGISDKEIKDMIDMYKLMGYRIISIK